MTPQIRRIPIGNIRLDFQPRENLLEETVLEYVNELQHRKALPAIRVRFDGDNYFLQDGFHRIEAAKRCRLKTLKAEIYSGSLKDMERKWQDYLKSLKLALSNGEGQ